MGWGGGATLASPNWADVPHGALPRQDWDWQPHANTLRPAGLSEGFEPMTFGNIPPFPTQISRPTVVYFVTQH